MNKLILALLLVLLLSTAEGRRRKPALEETERTEEEKTTVIEANHFFSETETSTLLDVHGLIQNKPLLFLLEPSNAQQEKNLKGEFNPITVTLTSGDQSIACVLQRFFGLCSIPKVASDKTQLRLECKSKPCEARWELVQPETVEVDGKHEINHLVSINKDKNHAILKAYCSDPELKETMRTALRLYTNSFFEPIDTTEGEMLYLFNNEEKGEYYLTTKNEAVKKCTEVTLDHALEEVDLKAEGEVIHDFISSREENEYFLKGKPKTDIMVEILAHDAAYNELTNSSGITVKYVGVKDKT
jgi:hypothetical protein